MATASLVVKVTVGKDDAERCSQAVTVAATAAASGIPVSLWLAGEATWLALPGHAERISLPHSSPIADLLQTVVKEGAVTVCTQCIARRDIAADDLLPGIRVAGAPSFLAEVMADGAKALVY
jgi:predicted peroxiredoxin